VKRPFHPILLAAYPVLSLYSLNQGLVPFNQVLFPVAMVLLAVALVWSLVGLAFRNAERGALVASAAVTGFFLYGHLRDALHVSDRVALEIWGPAYLLLLVSAAWKWKSRERATAALNAISLLLVCFPLASLAIGGPKHEAAAVKRFGVPNSPRRPDIIHVVLDGYGRSDALRRVMNLDNEPFVRELEARGFRVLPRARANYLQTEQSLSSALNLNYLPQLFPDADPNSMDRAPLDEAVDQSLVSQRLRALGYSVVAITTGFPFFSFRSADLVLGEDSGQSLFLTSLLNLTPLQLHDNVVQSLYKVKREAVKSAFLNLAELSAPSRTPKFIFAHILMPHPPFVFGPNGEPTELRAGGPYLADGSHYMAMGGTPELYRKGYVGQITYLNKLVLQTLDAVLRNAKKDTIIVIQGDHGSKLGLDQDSLAKTDVAEVAPILMAIKGAQAPEDLTPVNLYRTIFSEEFGDSLEPLPSKTFYSTWERPYQFTDVTAQVP
jgi:hypothetical protein